MITDRFGHQYPDILTALRANREYDARWARDDDMSNRLDLESLRRTIDFIIASASAEKAAAERIGRGESAEVVIEAACGKVAA